jgi:hypothetical protein
MNNLPDISTLGNKPRWVDDIGKEFQMRRETAVFTHSFGRGDLLIRELVDNKKFDSNPALASSGEQGNLVMTMTQSRPEPTRIPRVKRVNTLPEGRYILLKKYEGFITVKKEQSFTTRLFENNSDYPVLEAEIDFEELSETDRELVAEGAAIVWTIGYRYEGNTRKRESVIYMRRLPLWQDEEIEYAKREADELTRDICWK